MVIGLSRPIIPVIHESVENSKAVKMPIPALRHIRQNSNLDILQRISGLDKLEMTNLISFQRVISISKI